MSQRYNPKVAQQQEVVAPPGFSVKQDKSPQVVKNPEQVVYVSISTGAREPGQAVSAAPSISPNLAQSLIQSNKQNYRAGQTVTVTDGAQEFNFKRSGDKVVKKTEVKKSRRSRSDRTSAEGHLSNAEVARGTY